MKSYGGGTGRQSQSSIPPVALESTLAAICDQPRLSALSAAISEFDFDGARKSLDEIAREYGGNWGLAR